MLISKLEKNKTMKSEDKAEIMKTLEILTKNITKLKDEVKSTSPGRCLPKSIKTKTQVFRFVSHVTTYEGVGWERWLSA